MTIEEIRRQGMKLGWTRPQAYYLTDIIRNAVVVLGSREPQPQSAVDTACGKLLACVGAVADVGYEKPARPDPRAQTVCIACGCMPCVCRVRGALAQQLEARSRVQAATSGPQSER